MQHFFAYKHYDTEQRTWSIKNPTLQAAFSYYAHWILNLQNLNHWLHSFTVFLWTMECRIWNLKYWLHFAIKLCGNTLNTVYILHFFLHKLCDTTQNLKHYILLSFFLNSVTHNIAPKTFWPQAIDCVFCNKHYDTEQRTWSTLHAAFFYCACWILNLQDFNHWLHSFTVFLQIMGCSIWNLRYWLHFAIKLSDTQQRIWNILITGYILLFIFLQTLCHTT